MSLLCASFIKKKYNFIVDKRDDNLDIKWNSVNILGLL